MTINCTVDSIVFHNEENGFTVIKARFDDGVSYPRSAVGTMFGIHVGSNLELTGEWTVDRYGKKFAITSYLEKLPNTLMGMETYLGSGLIKGIGPAKARAIVEKFGENTFDILNNEIDRLLEVNGIGPNKLSKIKESWYEQRGVRDIMVFLQGNGISTTNALKIYRKYGKDSIGIVKENPYRLIDDIDGIGFKLSDSIALSLGYRKDDVRRCRAGIKYALMQSTYSGNVYMQVNELLASVSKILKIEVDYLESVIKGLIESNELYYEIDPESNEEGIYLPLYYETERSISKKLMLLLNGFSDHQINVDVERIILSSPFPYAEAQAEAIRVAAKSKVMILTGGPGTGKTSTTKGILSLFEEAGLTVLLAAPTGRASKRLTEAINGKGEERNVARTIHSLLEFDPQSKTFKRNSSNPLVGDVLLIDESSMIDNLLFYSLLEAMPLGMRLVLVGDVDQLPSVGAGNVLRDIINSDMIPVIRLTEVFRQSQSSRIVTNAHKINEGRYIDYEYDNESDFQFITIEDPDKIADYIVNSVSHYIPHNTNFSLDDIQVLSPMKKGPLGTIILNNRLQAALNPGKVGVKSGNYTYCVGDRVMHTKNSCDKGIFNGDIGIVTYVDIEDRSIVVKYSETKSITYEDFDFENLTLAYATTIHKSQGSEYPVVIMPVSMSHRIMLQRNLIYTGLTRSKKLCVLVGTRDALDYSIANSTINKRRTRLEKRLRGVL